MDRQQFIEQFSMASDIIDPEYTDHVVDVCIGLLSDNFPQQENLPDYRSASRVLMAVMEESAEFVEEVSKRMRGRTIDNYGIIEESADVILNTLCTCRLFGISGTDLKKAVNVKLVRAENKRTWGGKAGS